MRLAISAVLPARDEEGNLGPVVTDLEAVLERVASSFEIIVVDDGSIDRTGDVVSELARGDPRVKFVRHPRNLGYGAALRSGIAAATLDWVFLTDADGQFAMGSLEDLVQLAETADAVVGFREGRADPWGRRLLGALWTRMTGALLGLRVRDVNCAFKLVRRSFLSRIELRVSGAAINAEILLGIRARGGRIVEAPVPHRPRRAGRQSGARPGVIARALADLARLWARRRGPRPRSP